MRVEIKAPTSPMEGSPEEEAGETPKFEDHELDHMADTLQHAHEIQQDPHKMKALGPHIEKRKNAINSVAKLRSLAKAKGAF